MKPMLAAKPDPKRELRDLHWPLLASPKFDGIRAVNDWGQLKTRRLTPVRNDYVRNSLSKKYLHGLDGELYVPPEVADFHTLSGCIRAKTHLLAPEVKFHVFDCFLHPGEPFEKRLARAAELAAEADTRVPVVPVPHKLLRSLDAFLEFETSVLEDGFEGVCLRDPLGRYKYGRSTMREHWLIKVKRFTDAEAQVIGFEEQMHNANEATTDALGKTKRSKHQENMSGKNTLGALVVRGLNGPFKGKEFKISGGSKAEGAIPFDDAFRKEVWTHQSRYRNRVCTYTYFAPGSKDLPRHAGLFRWRDDFYD